MNAKTTIYTARKIHTMAPERPHASAVAVRDGRILAVGELPDIIHWLKKSPFCPFEVETLFADKILVPGLIDAHTHLGSLALEYSNTFIAQVPWSRPEGGFFPTYADKNAVLERLREQDAALAPGETLWGVHYDDMQAGEPLSRADLDSVSQTRPILVSNMVFHRFWVNSAMLRLAKIEAGSELPGVCYDASGEPDGTLLENKGLRQVLPAVPTLMHLTEDKVRNILPLFTNQGMTTVCEAAFGGFGGLERELDVFGAVFGAHECGLRMQAMPFYHRLILEGNFADRAAIICSLQDRQTANLRFGAAKLYCDGSIVSRTAPLDWPGFWDGTPNQKMQHTPEEIREAICGFHDLGIPTATHTNTNLACQIVLDAVEEAQSRCCRPDIRHRMEHCYGITPEQLRRAKALGVAIQFFTPQIWYYGDSHLALQGPDRAQRMLPTATAKRLGVSWGVHCDPPGSPQLPWMAMWATVHRLTQSGEVLGPNQRMSVYEALWAFTQEHAWQLHLEQEVGSIEFGKKADFCVLEADPLGIDPMELKDMPVWGTVFEGTPHRAKKQEKI